MMIPAIHLLEITQCIVGKINNRIIDNTQKIAIKSNNSYSLNRKITLIILQFKLKTLMNRTYSLTWMTVLNIKKLKIVMSIKTNIMTIYIKIIKRNPQPCNTLIILAPYLKVIRIKRMQNKIKYIVKQIIIIATY